MFTQNLENIKMDNIEFPEIWLSSTDHLDKFNVIAHKLKWWKQIFIKQKIDNSFPHIDINGNKIPVVFYSSGILKIENEKLLFEAKKPKDILTSKYMNIDNLVKFELNLKEIKEVCRYKIPNARYENHNHAWVKINMKDGREFLFLSGLKRGEVEKGLENTDKLYKIIKNNIAE